MRDARDAAAQTPPDVRTALLAGPRSVESLTGRVTFQPLSLGTLWLLEEIGHPLLKTSQDAAPAELPIRDIVSALFVFANPADARAAISESRAVFDAEAQAFAGNFAPSQFESLVAVLSTIISEGLATAPAGGGKPNP